MSTVTVRCCRSVSEGGGCSGALTGILECVGLSASLCLDKAACPLSLMPQLGRGMPPYS
ncbi:Hypothetical protein SMAX5B_014183 [Scophthalmus maximus]|uniref:Uncharacterized protein n=1 Tax=Scophthalmus maximus TaxID=52904 RepID=A0A2U9BH99_SCOMX|nr:Hypothetical protein SMAX5B_014183 [Scophthalmus maximus]